MTRQLRLGAFVQATGHHVSSWLDPETEANAGHDLDHYKHLARVAEAAKFDLIFVADSPGGYADFTDDSVFRQNAKAAHFEPITLWAALAQVTTHLGFVATSTTTYEDPYTTARKFASLDWVSGGRAGWNVVTTGADVSANFGFQAHPAHADRYARAEEFIDVVRGLWDSYEDDAFVRDRASATYLDTSKFHVLNHVGEHFSVRGPLNIARPPQGYPVIVQAGASEPGRELAARTAEVIFTANLNIEDAQAFYADVKARLPRYGRRPDQLLVMPGIFPVIGGTEAEAWDRYEALQALVTPEVAWSILRRHYAGVDLSGYSLDDTAPPLPTDTNLNKSRLKLVSDFVERKRPTLRELYREVATARGHFTTVGTPEQVADTIERWFREGAADGFNIMPPTLPRGLEVFTSEVVPILQRRGLFRTDYAGTTLRDHLGLDRPAHPATRAESAGTIAAE
jgi:N-acetyl-S-(2-succino)cysteine monooxygenase